MRTLLKEIISWIKFKTGIVDLEWFTFLKVSSNFYHYRFFPFQTRKRFLVSRFDQIYEGNTYFSS